MSSPRFYPRGGRRRAKSPGLRAAAMWCPHEVIEFERPHRLPDDVIARRWRDRHRRCKAA
ncbi:hypothetical protein [Candidatus Poriferisocius sp.]|uniref:hypothetical protein n=1 Tax=Candidatus Poriferisocius sp. TaxID=3101276 RepID=UPI003B5C9F90